MGWFRFEEVTKEKGRVSIRASVNFECEGRKSAKPYSQFVRGHLSGALTALLGRPMKCDEAKCIACDDTYCEFVLTKQEA